MTVKWKILPSWCFTSSSSGLQAHSFYLPVISHFLWRSREGMVQSSSTFLSVLIVLCIFCIYSSTHLDLGSFFQHYLGFRKLSQLLSHAKKFPGGMVTHQNKQTTWLEVVNILVYYHKPRKPSMLKQYQWKCTKVHQSIWPIHLFHCA